MESINDVKDPVIVRDYENLAKRLLGCMYYGIRVEPYAGHRWIIVDLDADNLPRDLYQKFVTNKFFDTDDKTMQEKFYGSVIAALDLIDTWLIEAKSMTTLEAYDCYIMTDINEDGDIDDQRVFGTLDTE